MRLGTYSPEIERPTIDEMFRDTNGYGFGCTQFSFMSMPAADGVTDIMTRITRGDEMPDVITDETIAEIKTAAAKYDIEFAAVNGTYNMSAATPEERKKGLQHLETVAKAAVKLGAPIITLCTGSRERPGWEFGWMWDDRNNTPEAWADMRESVVGACEIAEKYDLKLGIEIEASNVVDNAEKARRLFDEIGSKRLGLIYDGANLFKTGDVSHDYVIEVMKRTFDTFEDDIVLIHGKDLANKPGVNFASCGYGIVDFDYFLERVKQIGYKGPMIVHGVHPEALFPESVEYMKKAIDRAGL